MQCFTRLSRHVHAAGAMVVIVSMVFISAVQSGGAASIDGRRDAADQITEQRMAQAEPEADTPLEDPPPESPTQPPTDCTDVEKERPASAQHILVFPEQEVGVIAIEASGVEQRTFLQYTAGSLSTLRTENSLGADKYFQSAAVDLNGDGWDEVVNAYRDDNRALAVESLIGPLSGGKNDIWNSNTDRLKGDNVKWIDIAAGNLMQNSDHQREAVVATRNNDGDLELILFDGSADGGIAPLDGQTVSGGTYIDATDGRENVLHVSVAVGDLNGDGYDDDIVTAFKDGGNHLQVLALRYKNGKWEKLAGYRYTDAATSHGAEDVCNNGDGLEVPKRGIDVATGDVEGDGLDEAVISFVDNDMHLQTIAMGLTPATAGTTPPYQLIEDGYYRTEEDTRDPDYVSVAAPDLNGDGLAEILVAFAGRHDCCTVGAAPAQVWRLSYGKWVDDTNDPDDEGFNLKRDNVWKDDVAWNAGKYKFAELVSLAKVNVDKGEREMAILGFNEGRPSNPDLVGVRLLHEPGDAKSLTIKDTRDIATYAPDNTEVSAFAVDYDGDSSWLTYTNTCKKYGMSALSTVINMPPLWYDYSKSYHGVGAAFGTGMTGEVANSETTTYNYGASITVDGSGSFGGGRFEAGPQYSVAFQGSQAVTKEESVAMGTEEEYTTVFGSDSTSGLVVQQTVDYRLYKYTEDRTGRPVWVRAPVMRAEYNDSMEKWNTRQNYRGWMPVGPGPRINLALGKPAKQSTTDSGGAAGNAVDGITSGDLSEHPGASTQAQPNAWWQVDLGGPQPIEAVTIWNRSDCCAERLTNYRVKLSDIDTSASWLSPKWQSQKYTDFAGSPSVVPVGQTARYLRVQFVDDYSEKLTLAEVEVWQDPRVNLALGKPARQSSNYNGVNSAGRAVDGNLDGSIEDVVSRTNSEANAWWQVDLGATYPISEIDIWNRTGTGSEWLKNYVIKLSNEDTDAGWAGAKWTSIKHEATGERPTTDKVGQKARYVRVQFVEDYANPLSLAEVQVWKGREASDFPKGIRRDSDISFTITDTLGIELTVPGNLKWSWCDGYLDKDVEAVDGRLVTDLIAEQDAQLSYKGQTDDVWKISKGYKEDSAWSDSWGISGSFGYEAKFMGIGAAVAATGGFGKENTTTRSWSKETYMEGTAGYMDQSVRVRDFSYCPYYYLTTSTTADGIQQAYLVLDYYVPLIGTMPASLGATDLAPQEAPQGAPQAPLIESATHPDPDAWSTKATATFTWRQPAGDPVTAPLYAWVLDRQPDTVPTRVNGPNQSDSFFNLPDGAYYLHVRAMSPGGEWGDTAHRRIRIDRLAPGVALVRAPSEPDGNQGWYTVPVTVTVAATDNGSGVAAVETSPDGATWQRYAGPQGFTTDTPGTTIWARASDAAGHVSEPVSTTVKVDLSAPNSGGTGGCAPGGVCAGGVWERTSGLAGMEIQVDGGSWTSADILSQWPDAPNTWAFAALLEVGNGYHIVNGRASDGAGHVEAPHKIGERIWYPTASPDLSASSIALEPAIARPGAKVTATLTVRNGGFQEGYVAIKAKMPDGLAPAPGALATLDGSIAYDPATGIINWPVRLLWPGDFWRTQFEVVVANGLAPGVLTAELDVHASWPNVDLLPPDEQQRFRAFEASAKVSAGLQVDPQLPAGQDVTAPRVSLTLDDEMGAAGARVDLALQADADARLLYLREWTLNPVSGAWTAVRSSGWIPYAPSVTWQLSDGGGAKYLGAWVADAAGNVSQLDEDSLAFTNRLVDENLLAGQRRQYRYRLESGIAVFNLLTTAGEADLYAWLPGQSDVPAYTAQGSGLVKSLGFQVVLEGLYLLEASAVQDSTYRLLNAMAAGAGSAAAASQASQIAGAPQRPLTLTTPLTGGAAATPGLEPKPTYLPVILR